MKEDNNDGMSVSVSTTLILAFWGEPDLWDALIHRIDGYCE